MSRRKSKFVFGSAPILRHSRSIFDLSHSHKTAFNTGELIPFCVLDVYPGDTFKVDTSVVFRTAYPLVRPSMDNAFLDMFYFFVPSRLLYDNFEGIFGDPSPNGWVESPTYECPTPYEGTVSLNVSADDFVGTIADYMGLPPEYQAKWALTGGKGDLIKVNIMPLRAYAKIYDDWFRDENIIDPMLIQTGDTNSNETFNFAEFSPNNYFGLPAKISKMHDYFTQVLPSPQRGEAVDLPLGTIAEQTLRVYPKKGMTAFSNGNSLPPDVDLPRSMYFYPVEQEYYNWSNATLGGVVPYFTGGGLENSFVHNVSYNSATNSSFTGGHLPLLSISTPTDFAYIGQSFPTNLGVTVPETNIGAVTVNDLRFAFQVQRMLERSSRGGARYREYLQQAFSVSSPDARLQVSEYLGGARCPVNIFQVNQTSGNTTAQAETADTPLASVGAFSLSGGHARFTKSFVEHGFVIGLCAIRQFHTYQQGIERFWTRKGRFDFYDPIFQSLGEQPTYSYELFSTANANDIFGYNPAWEDLRTRKSRVSGKMRSGVTDSLDTWHFADFYDNQPYLTPGFIQETPEFIDRALSVSSKNAPQFIFDFFVKNKGVRCLPTYSIPGLIDHY